MNKIRTRLTLAAGLVIVVLTVAAFWLSYAHLHDVASAHGLGGSVARAWAWPATLDLFIVAGEIMMLVAAMSKRRDAWAIALTAAGSIGSICLNVYGVGSGAPKIDYVVAAVPPSAALLAFGALMRQIHRAVAGEEEQTAQATDEVVNDQPEALEEDLAPAWPMNGPLMILEEPKAGLAEVLAGEEDVNDSPEPDEDEEGDLEDITPVHVISTKPTLKEISAAVDDIRSERVPLSGMALARYFGVSDRTGRRYLKDWSAAQDAA
ncbi:DUF2637 domain-containing protein [Streptomyces sp. NPDC015414]|uniref:DUF2637 domain-containing protein n=1 Tax=Streptomyces sp. NPDC015414 TaxID=3364957 RepID=UPI003701E1B0